MATATRNRKAAPKPQVPADVPETDDEVDAKLDKATPAPKPAAPTSAKGGNSAYAPEEVRAKLAERLNLMREDGWTRPAISAIIGYTDSQVWRAFNNKAHTSEMDTWVKFIQEVDAGTHTPPAPRRKAKPEELQAKIDAAVAKLGDEAKTVAQYRKVLEEAKALLTA